MTEKEKRDRGFLYNANYDEEILNEISSFFRVHTKHGHKGNGCINYRSKKRFIAEFVIGTEYLSQNKYCPN